MADETTPIPAAVTTSRSRGSWGPLLVLAAGLVACLIVESRYWQIGPYFDDYYHRAFAQQVLDGQRTLGGYLLLNHNEHFLPAWRLWYFGQYAAFENDWLTWHLAMTAAHAGIGLCIFFLLRRYLDDAWAAAFGASLWLIAAIGGADNPDLWIGASHLSFALLWVLVAMVCASHAGRPHGALWSVAMALSMGLAVATMSPTWLILFVVPVQLALLERPAAAAAGATPSWRIWMFLACGSIAALGAVSTFVLVSPTVANWEIQLSPSGIPAAMGRAAAGTTLSLVKLLAGDVGVPKPGTLALAGVAILIVLALCGRFLAGSWRLLIVISVLVAPYLVLSHWARLHVSLQSTLSWGRYAYLPTIGWCLIVGCILAGLGARLSQRGRVVALTIVGLLWIAAVPVQLRLARSGVLQFQDSLRGTEDVVAYFEPMIRAMADVARTRGAPVRILNQPAAVPRAPFLSTLDALVAARQQIRIAGANEYTQGDFADAQKVLEELHQSPLIRNRCQDWSTAQLLTFELAQVLKQLSQAASQRGSPLRVPNLPLNYPLHQTQTLEEFIQLQFGDTLAGIEILPRGAENRDAEAIADALAEVSSPVAQYLRDAMVRYPEP